MGKTACSEILPGLYIATAKAASDEATLRRLGIEGILSVGGGTRHLNLVDQHHHVGVVDKEGVPLRPYFNECADFIANTKRKGPVLVHCRAGIHRSPCIVAAYLIRDLGYTADDAITLIKHQRPQARFLGARLEKELRDYYEELNLEG
eukprot:m.344420 g.344420  ORF g.344420 m.344420 type:complete len:148 (-) comp24445_c0_seq1:83-526(-)